MLSVDAVTRCTVAEQHVHVEVAYAKETEQALLAVEGEKGLTV